jgi:hypothetical protein
LCLRHGGQRQQRQQEQQIFNARFHKVLRVFSAS